MHFSLPLFLVLVGGNADDLATKLDALKCRDSKALRSLLVQPETLTKRVTRETCTTHAGTCQPLHHLWWKMPRVGCAAATTSSDGRVRIWTTYPPDGKVRAEEEPSGYVTWKDASGTIRVHRGDGLHLGSIIDAIEVLPGSTEYLVMGLTYGLRRPVRRFAYVLRVDGERPTKVRRRFRRKGRFMDELLLEGRAPETGKFRHHELALYWLRYYIAAGEIVLEPIGETRPMSLLPPRTAAVAKGGVFEVARNERIARMGTRRKR